MTKCHGPFHLGLCSKYRIGGGLTYLDAIHGSSKTSQIANSFCYHISEDERRKRVMVSTVAQEHDARSCDHGPYLGMVRLHGAIDTVACGDNDANSWGKRIMSVENMWRARFTAGAMAGWFYCS